MNRNSTEAEYSQLVDRYKDFRKVNQRLHSALLSYLPKKELKECAEKLGISKSGVFVFQEQHEADVLIDYCIYDYYEDGIFFYITEVELESMEIDIEDLKLEPSWFEDEEDEEND